MRLRPATVQLLVAALFLAGAVAVRVGDGFAVQALRLLGFDLYQRVLPAEPLPDSPITVVDIDEESLKAVGQWPWSRTIVGDLTRKLAEAGAAAIVFDVLFSEPDQTSPEEIVKRLPPADASRVAAALAPGPTHDEAFAATLATTPAVVSLSLSTAPSPPPALPAGFAVAGDDPKPFIPDYGGVVANVPAIDAAAQGIGALNWIPDRDQIVRRVPLVFRIGDTFVPSLAAEALRVAQGARSYLLKASNASGEEAFGRSTGLNHIRIGDFIIPTDADGAIWLRYRPSDPQRFVSAKDVLAGTAPPARLAGAIVLVGTSAAGLLDLRATPIDAAVPGVEIHAQVLEHILAGRSLTRPDWATGFELAVIVVLGLGLAALLPRLSAGPAAAVGGLAIGGLIAGGFAAFDRLGLLFDPLYPALALLLLVAGVTLDTYRRAERARAELRHAFTHYVAPAVVDEIVLHPDRLELGGEVRELTLLFCDVRSFTTLSEGMSAQELTRFINGLMTPLSEIVLEHRGTIDKYMGDGLMAFWNAPLDDADHPAHAATAAAAMLAAMEGLNARWQDEAHQAGRTMQRVAIGIGVNTGPCCVGNLGSTRRFNYSAIGDEVNVASRFEGLTKAYGVGAILGEQTAAAARLPTIEIDSVRVRGRSRPTRIFTLLPEDTPSALPAAQAEFLEAYRAGDFAAATERLDRAARLAPTGLVPYYEKMARRLARLAELSKPEDWDGTIDAATL